MDRFGQAADMAIWIALASILAFVVVDDLRNYRIRNVVVLALTAIFPAHAILHLELGQVLQHVGIAAAVFVLLAVMFVWGMIGGGDVKLLTVAFLWLGLEMAAPFSILMSALAAAYALAATAGLAPARLHAGKGSVPFGPSIAVAWLATMALFIPAGVYG